MSGFFALRSSRDMFAKLGREYRLLLAEPVIDNVFNFFVTAFHVKDYLEHEGAVEKGSIGTLYEHPDMQTCEHLCNKGKHMVLTRGKFNKATGRPDPIARETSGAIGGFVLNSTAINDAPLWSIYYPDDQTSVEVLPLADRVMSRLAQFFSDHQL